MITLNSTLSITKGTYGQIIQGCTVCPNGKMVFADGTKGRLIILNDDGTVDKDISCCDVFSGPNDVTSIDKRTVAVTSVSGIQIISIESNQAERTIRTSGACSGITHDEGALLWYEKSNGIQMLRHTNRGVTTVVKQDRLKGDADISTCGDKIYLTDNSNHTVTCYTTKGDKVWEYKDELVVKRPSGVAVDKHHCVYVTSCDTNSLVVLSSDGKQSRTLLGQEHGLDGPSALHYDTTKNILLVCSYLGRAFVYDISY